MPEHDTERQDSVLTREQIEQIRFRNDIDDPGRQEVRAVCDTAIALTQTCGEQRERLGEMEARLAEAREATEEEAHVRELLARRLAEVCLALKGPDEPLTRHDWSDLGAVAAKLKLTCDLSEVMLADERKAREQAERERDEAKRNEARYLWLRDRSVRAPHHTPTVFRHGGGSDIIDGLELDDAIDAAMQAPGTKEETR